jgi:hypothetical protein
VAAPADAGALVVQTGSVWGWLALAAALLPAAWHLSAALPRVHALGALCLGVGVLAACSAAAWDGGDWLAYHVLTAVCAALGVTTLLAGWSRRGVGQAFQPDPPASSVRLEA